MGRGRLEVMAGASTLSGPFARAELAYHPLDPLSVYGFGQWTPRESMAGLGARYTF